MAQAQDFAGLKKQIAKETGVEVSIVALRTMELRARGGNVVTRLSGDMAHRSWSMNNGFVQEFEFSTFTSVDELLSLNPQLAKACA